MRLTVPLEVLVVVATVLVTASVLLLLGVVGGTAATRFRQRRQARIHRKLQPLLRHVVVDGSELPDAGWWLSRLSWSEQVSQLGDLAKTLSGESRERVVTLAHDTGLLTHAHRWTFSRRWRRRLRAARAITLVGGGESDIPRLLTDPHPEVRAQAADWVAEHGTPDQVAEMLAALDGDPRLNGYTLTDCLYRAGPRAAPALRAFLAQEDVRTPLPALEAGIRIADATLSEPARRWSSASEPAPRASATRLLGAIGDPAALAQVRERLTDEAAVVRAAAADALGRLQHWPAAPDLATALTDAAFEVRRAAGLALRELGPTGLLYLRRTERADDPFAADMARHVLSLPE